MMKTYFRFGLRHEVAKRWTFRDWLLSKKVSRLIDDQHADRIIVEAIKLKNPLLIGRLGGTEARFIGEYLKIKKSKFPSRLLFRYKPRWKRRSFEINNNAGFYFRDISDVDRFFRLYDNALRDTDILGAWGTAFSWIESNYVGFIKKFIPVPMTAPWISTYSEDPEEVPWADSLSGKTVLVISPFTETILLQHSKIKQVFPSKNYPSFSLKLIKSPQTIGYDSRSEPNWFNRLKDIEQLMLKEEFDIALIAAGAYSYPLAYFAKKMGKIGIHAGGGLQLFFGIMGKRWEKDWGSGNPLEKHWNENWTRPSADEKPANADNVEDACYW